MQKKSRMLRVGRFAWLALPLLLLTGCPHNHYIVELTPRGSVLERTLVFYCEDGTDTNGIPNYRGFPTNELVEIARCYPPGALKQAGQRHTVTGEFSAVMPPDIGGAGSYTNVTTMLGSTGFYMERFRGDDDLATRTARRLHAADQFVDLILGWSRMALGHERNYQRLRRFLDNDFRKDAKNLSLYVWLWQASGSSNSAAPEEFGVRFAQYLLERGYLKLEQVPTAFRAANENDLAGVMQLLQRFVATKLGVPSSASIPPSLAFLSDPVRAEKSWEDYLTTTDQYRVKLRHWQKEKIVSDLGVLQRRVTGLYNPHPRTNRPAPPAVPAKPLPSDVTDDIFRELIAFDLGTDDHVAVQLKLDTAPTHTNGKWDEARKQVLWDSDLERPEGAERVPTFCYASWNQADEVAQTAHFGKVVLTGDALAQYCLWRAALFTNEAVEWDSMVASLRPGEGLKERLVAFRFSGPRSQGSNNAPPPVDASAFARDLILSGIKDKK